MTARFCTIESSSEDGARKAGAQELGVPSEDVSVRDLEGGSFRVEVVRAPSIIEVARRNNDMEAVVTRITPPLGDYPPATRESVEAALAEIGVTAGLLSDEIDELVAAVSESKNERKNVTVARGLLPRAGTNAKITRHYLCATEQAPDRRKLVVRSGELLIEREPATLGEAGLTVTGQTLPAAAGAEEEVPHGEGIVSDEDGLRWTASVPAFGYLELDEANGPSVVPAVTVSEDGLRARLDLRRPGADEPPIPRHEVDAAIEACGVVHGLSPERVETAWSAFEERAPREPALIAEGTPSVPGRDAGLALEVDTDMLIGDLGKEVDQIDYRERRMVKNIQAGRRIGTWLPETAGVPGRGVDGQELRARAGEPAPFTARENILTHELEDGTLVFEASIDGMLLVRPKNELAVVDVLEISGDVDYQTGHIDAKGSVLVRGTVRSEFRVTARHDIAVQKSVEDASIEARDALDVGMGILGGQLGRVSAGSRVSVKFAQNANITCGGDVEIGDSDTNSVIECIGQLLATEGRGTLRGGRYTAVQGLKAKVLGSELGAPTVVSGGADPVLDRELREVQEGLRGIQAKKRKLEGFLSRPMMQNTSNMSREQSLAVRKCIKAKRELVSSEAALKARRLRAEEKLFEGEPPTVEVQGTVHAGVDIYIRGAHLQTEESAQHVRFYYDPESRDIQAEAL